MGSVTSSAPIETLSAFHEPPCASTIWTSYEPATRPARVQSPSSEMRSSKVSLVQSGDPAARVRERSRRPQSHDRGVDVAHVDGLCPKCITDDAHLPQPVGQGDIARSGNGDFRFRRGGRAVDPPRKERHLPKLVRSFVNGRSDLSRAHAERVQRDGGRQDRPTSDKHRRLSPCSSACRHSSSNRTLRAAPTRRRRSPCMYHRGDTQARIPCTPDCSCSTLHRSASSARCNCRPSWSASTSRLPLRPSLG